MVRQGRSVWLLSLPAFRRLCMVNAGLLLLLTGSVSAVTVRQISSPRPVGWVNDLTTSFTPEAVQALNRLGDEVKAQTGAEMAVVTAGIVEDATPPELGTRLLNNWEIGPRGLLLYATLNPPGTGIVLGTYLDSEEARSEAEAIVQEEMLPRYHDGDIAGALLLGADAAARRILHVTPTVQVAVLAPSPRRWPARALWLLGFIAALGGVLAYFKLVPPRCRDCRKPMVKLSETGDDLFLEPFEQTEEQVGRVNYDVWLCQECGRIVKRRWLGPFSGRRIVERETQA